MSQISQPVRIILIGAVVFLAAWFAVLRPKPVEVEPQTTTTTAIATSTPATGPGRAVAAAKKAAAQASGITPPATDPATEPATKVAPAAKAEVPVAIAIPAEALAKFPKDVAGALKARKVLVLAVLGDRSTAWSPTADDERYVRNALRKVNDYDGQVLVKRVVSSKLSTYGSLVNSLNVHQTPSVVVIDRDLKGKVLTGYVDRIAINQAIADARRDSVQPNITDPYLRQANEICAHFETRVNRWSHPTVRGKKPLTASYQRGVTFIRKYRRQIARTPAPAKYRSLKKQWLKVMTASEHRAVALVKASKSGKLAEGVKADAVYSKRDLASLDRKFNEAGLTDCASNRRS